MLGAPDVCGVGARARTGDVTQLAAQRCPQSRGRRAHLHRLLLLLVLLPLQVLPAVSVKVLAFDVYCR